jgi:hypothetical protein
MSEELKPCPFCVGIARVGHGFVNDQLIVEHARNCILRGRTDFIITDPAKEAHLRESWNTRAEPVRKVKLTLHGHPETGPFYDVDEVKAILKAANIEVAE